MLSKTRRREGHTRREKSLGGFLTNLLFYEAHIEVLSLVPVSTYNFNYFTVICVEASLKIPS